MYVATIVRLFHLPCYNRSEYPEKSGILMRIDVLDYPTVFMATDIG